MEGTTGDFYVKSESCDFRERQVVERWYDCPKLGVIWGLSVQTTPGYAARDVLSECTILNSMMTSVYDNKDNTVHLADASLQDLLHRRVAAKERAAISGHLDECAACRARWVDARWAAASQSPSFGDLATFLPPDELQAYDSSWRLADEWIETPRDTVAKVEAFYATTGWYVHNLFVWAESGQRPPYVEQFIDDLRRYDVQSIVDFGTGVGTDAIRLIKAEFTVYMIDINQRCRDFLRHRLRRHGLSDHASRIATDYTLVPATFDALWLMDVIEHLPEPDNTLAPLLMRCRVVVYDTESSSKAGGRHPFHYEHDPERIANLFKTHGFRERVGEGAEGRIWAR